jgi:hypothetical protein
MRLIILANYTLYFSPFFANAKHHLPALSFCINTFIPVSMHLTEFFIFAFLRD